VRLDAHPIVTAGLTGKLRAAGERRRDLNPRLLNPIAAAPEIQNALPARFSLAIHGILPYSAPGIEDKIREIPFQTIEHSRVRSSETGDLSLGDGTGVLSPWRRALNAEGLHVNTFVSRQHAVEYYGHYKITKERGSIPDPVPDHFSKRGITVDGSLALWEG
jgi:hypothetical protein